MTARSSDDSMVGFSTSDWATERAAPWLAHADRLEAMLAPVDGVVFNHAGLDAGEHVVDVGCGRGATSRHAASLVGREGSVLGIDVSPAMIEAAVATPRDHEMARIDWVTADASAHAFAPSAADVVISRFGVMFFDDPVAAFSNLRRAARPGGRLAVAVWQPRDQSEFQHRAIDLAVDIAGGLGVMLEPEPPDAGPFAFGVEDRAVAIVGAAGWDDVQFHPHVIDFYLGGPGTTPSEAVEMGHAIGPLEVLLRDAPLEVWPPIDAALIADFETLWDGTGILLPGAIAVVTATAGGAAT